MAWDWTNFLSGLVARVPVEKILLPPPDHTGELEKFYHSLASAESPKQAASEEKTATTIPTTEKPFDKPIVAKAGTGCRSCTADHLATCAGSLAEALRFARGDGIQSAEVQERIALCAEELNIWERRDATPRSFVELPEPDKDFLRRWLPRGRGLRHQLNDIHTIEDLEKTAAHAQRLHLEARKELQSNPNSPFLDEVQRQAKRVRVGELTREQAVKEIEAWRKSVKA